MFSDLYYCVSPKQNKQKKKNLLYTFTGTSLFLIGILDCCEEKKTYLTAPICTKNVNFDFTEGLGNNTADNLLHAKY